MSAIENLLTDLNDDVWKEAHSISNSDQHRWKQREWWHNRYYLEHADAGSQVLTTVDGHREIPYERKLFFPSTGRFSLDDQPVAYFSDDLGTNCCETIDQFRNTQGLSWDELSRYLRGEFNPGMTAYGYPLNFEIDSTAALLDLSEPWRPPLTEIESQYHKSSGESFWESVVMSRDASSYDAARAVAEAANNRGFDGLVYKSVRAPQDMNMSDANLVMFNEDKVRPWHTWRR